MPSTSNTFRLPYEGMASLQYFEIAKTTSLGRDGLHTNKLNYSLLAGSRAGILLYPLKNLKLFFKSFTESLFLGYDCVAVVFVVELVGSIFLKTVKVKYRDLRKWDDNKNYSFEKLVASTEESRQMSAGVFTTQWVGIRVRIVVKNVEGRVVHMVRISEDCTPSI